LASDALSLIFLSRSQKLAQQVFPAAAAHAAQARNEVAAMAEAVKWHGLSWERVSERFQVHVEHGLTANQVNESRDRYGMNRLAEKQHTPWIVSYAGQFKEFTTLILLGTSVLALLTGGLFDGLAMGAVLFANAAIGTFQERKAERIVESLNQFQPPVSKVIREGTEQSVSAFDLVPGDIVCLEQGDRVPADIRLVRAWNLEVNESALTGESVPVAKKETEAEGDCPLPERSCMLYMGTDISRGKALGIVVQTGMNTEFGHLMSLLRTNEKTTTPLQEKVTSISKKIYQMGIHRRKYRICFRASPRRSVSSVGEHLDHVDGLGDSRRTSGYHYNRAKCGHLPHVQEKRARPQAVGFGDAGPCDHHLYGQNRHADEK
jgi:magnesium-transporting ATPase (P-type)